MSRQAAATPADVRAAIGVEELENVEANLRRSNEDPLCDELIDRLLQVRQGHVEDVKNTIISWSAWRAEHPIGWIPYAKVAPQLQGNTFLQGNSIQGHPLLILCLGTLNVTGESLIHLFMHALDVALLRADVSCNPSRRVCMIVDMQNVQYRGAAHIMHSTINMTREHYPGRMERVFIHRAPFYVWAAWNIIAQMLPPLAKTIVQTTSDSNILSHLQTLYNLEVIPVEYHGTAALQPLPTPT